MNQNILSRQMQDGYVALMAKLAEAKVKQEKASNPIPFVFVSVLYFGVILALSAWGIVAAWQVDASMGIVATVLGGGIVATFSIMFYNEVVIESWFDTREGHANRRFRAVAHDISHWWKQVSDLLERSGRGKLNKDYEPYNAVDKVAPYRWWYQDEKDGVKVTAVVKNGNVWLLTDDGGAVVRTYGADQMTTMIADDGTMIAVNSATAELMGMDKSHPEV